MATSRGKKPQNEKQVATSRFLLILVFLGIWIVGIGARLFYLQVLKHEELSRAATAQRTRPQSTQMMRGAIFDRDGNLLAQSYPTKSLAADPTMIENVDDAAKRLASALNLKVQDLKKTLKASKEGKKRFIWLARRVEQEEADRITRAVKGDHAGHDKGELGIAGLFWRNEQSRSYPNGPLAAHIVGFTNADGIGQAGIEQSQEGALKAPVVKTVIEVDRLGRPIEVVTQDSPEPPKNIYLTIRRSIQYKTEVALANGARAAYAKSAMAIVMDPRSGEILAMANYPSFDPNSYREAKPETWMNKSIQSIYSPGSVFKLMTYSTALEDNLLNIEQMIDCSRGVIEVGGHPFKDSHAIGLVSYKDAMAQSSNVAAITTGLRIGKDRMFGSLRNFGFGERTGIELPGELRGRLRSPERWAGDSIGSLSIGYEVDVTGLQMLTAYATIANDGMRPQPHVIKEIRGQDGSTIATTEPSFRQIVRPETAGEVKKMLRQVVLAGTGRRAQLNGYTSAGKTGTAWKFNPVLKKVDSGKYVSSFIGFAPYENPSVAILVVMDEPGVGARDGGTVSAPVFREIAEQILPELGIAPDANIKQGPPPAVEIPEAVEDEQGRGLTDEPSDERLAPPPVQEEKKSDKTENKKKESEKKKPEAALPKKATEKKKPEKEKAKPKK